MRGHQHLRRFAGKRRSAREQLVRDDAQRIKIGAMVCGGVAGRLLRSHVRRRANDETDRGDFPRVRGRGERFGDAEIRDRGVASREEYVLGLDIAVHHAALMGVGECVGNLA